MSTSFDLFEQTLHAAGQSVTKTRRAIFAALEHSEPQTMHQVVTRVGQQTDRASVYRTIALFERLGIIHRLQIGWKYKLELSDAFSYHHHHISCTNCGTMVPIREDKLLETTITSLAKEYGFTPSGHQIEIQGLCASCQKAANL